MSQTKQVTSKTISQSRVTNTRSRRKIKELAFIGVLGAASAVMMLFRFPIPFLPPFLSFDLSGVMEMLGGYMFGPMAAFFVILVKIMVQLSMQGSFSFGTGELQSLLLSCTYVLPAVMLYQHKKTKKMAIVGMMFSTLLVSGVAVLTNLYLIIPFYAKLSGMTMADFVAMCTAVNPAVKSAAGMVVLGIVPFNLIKYSATSAVTFLVYKRLSKFIRSAIER
ncbi:MAG: ECF transporter S component [Brotaphodocola sp.]